MSEFYEVDHPGPSLLENFLAINLQWGPQKTTTYIPNNKSSSCRWKAVKKVKLFWPDPSHHAQDEEGSALTEPLFLLLQFRHAQELHADRAQRQAADDLEWLIWGLSKQTCVCVCVCVYIIHRIYLIYTVSLFASSVNDLRICIYIYVICICNCIYLVDIHKFPMASMSMLFLQNA